jgi:mRNA interferase RelE/StbE
LLGDLIGWRKLVVGDRDWRIVWRVTTDAVGNRVIDIAEVWAVGARTDAEVYAEMNDRVAALDDSPITHALSKVIQRLGRAAGSVMAATEPVHDPVPPWLVDRLVHQVRMTPEAVAELTGAQAMQAWEDFITTR